MNKEDQLSPVEESFNDNDSSSSSSSSEGMIAEELAEAIRLLSIENKDLFAAKDIKGIAQYIKDKQCKNIIVLTGAGISVAAGIPDFRSPGTGLYDNLMKYKLPYPEAVFDLNYFRVNPKPFYSLVKELYPENISPTHCHLFVRLLHDKGLLLRNFTQNIDSLELLAEIPEEKLIFAHGSFADAHCISCDRGYTSEFTKEIIFKNEIPQCVDCQSFIKPRIVFFGESLPSRFESEVHEQMPKCDLLIVIGTSLKVFPFALLPDRVDPNCPRVLFNLTDVGKSKFCNVYRDSKILGDCQDSIKELVDALGWSDDFQVLVDKYINKKDISIKMSEEDTQKPIKTPDTPSKPIEENKE